MFFLVHSPQAAENNPDDPAIILDQYNDLFNADKKFCRLKNTATGEIIYSPKEKNAEAIEELLNIVLLAENIYIQARHLKKEQNPEFIFPYDHELYLSPFQMAIEAIKRNNQISDTNIRDIFAYLSAMQETEICPDVWDSIMDLLGLKYVLAFTSGFVSLDFSLEQPSLYSDWKAELIGDLETALDSSCKAATCLGFKLDYKPPLDKINTIEELAKKLEEKSKNQPKGTDSSQEYIAMLTSAVELVIPCFEIQRNAQDYLLEFGQKFQAKFGIPFTIDVNDELTQKTIVDHAIALVCKGELSDIRLALTDGAYILNYSTMDDFSKKKTATFSKLSKSHDGEKYTKKINSIGTIIADCKLKISAKREMRKLARAARIKSTADKQNDIQYEYLFDLLEDILIFDSARQEVLNLLGATATQAPRAKKITKEEEEQRKAEMFKEFGIKDEMPIGGHAKPRTKKSESTACDPEIIEPYTKFDRAGMHSDEGSLKRMAAQKTSAPSSKQEAPISRNLDKRFLSVETAMQAQCTAAAASNSQSKKPTRTVLDIFQKRNENNINFYNALSAQAKLLTNATPFETDFFHKEAQPKYKNFKQSLMQKGFKVIAHGEKDHFCWKVNGRFYHTAVDRAHGAQTEKGKAAGWFLRILQKITDSGLVIEKNTK